MTDRWIYEDGIPRLGPAEGSRSVSSKNRLHEPAEIVPIRFGNVRGIENLLRRPNVLSATYSGLESDGTLGGYGWEYEVHDHVKHVLVDVARSLYAEANFSQTIRFKTQPELEVDGQRADIWVIRRFGRIIGAIEVKKPGKGVMEDEQNASQLFDYLLQTREFQGIKHVFGILTSLKEWRVFCLPDCADVAARATLEPLQEFGPALHRELLRIPDWDNHPHNTLTVTAPTVLPPIQRRICASTEIVKFEDFMDDTAWKAQSRRLVEMLGSVLLKMVCSPIIPDRPLLHRDRFCIQVDAKAFFWVRFPKDYSGSLQLSKFPSNQIRNLLLVHHLGDGAHGRAWLASTLNGSAACVLKFPLSNESDLFFEEEEARWHEIWGGTAVNVRLQAFCDRRALLMPFFKTCTNADRSNPIVVAAANAAIVKMVSKGYRHNDLHWRHVGLYQKGGAIAAVLIDLGDTTPVPPNDPASIEAMRAELGL